MGKNARGQLTLETLLLAALALSLLLIAAQALSKMQKSEQTLFGRRILVSELQGLAAYSDEVCMLGEGNRRTMALAPGAGLELAAEGKALAVKSGSWNASQKTLCNETVDNADFGSAAYVWYEEPAGGEPLVHVSASPKQ